MYKGFPVRVAHRPLCLWEGICVVNNVQMAVEGSVKVGCLAIDEQYFLVDLPRVSAWSFLLCSEAADTHDPSDTDTTRGASGEVAGVCRGRSPLTEPVPTRLYR